MQRIGFVYVDSGTVWIGDPCYVLGEDASHGVKTWSDFCDKVSFDTDFREPLGEGVGISLQAGYGDGAYPVFIERNSEGVISRLIVDFESYPDDDPYGDWS